MAPVAGGSEEALWMARLEEHGRSLAARAQLPPLEPEPPEAPEQDEESDA